MVESLKIDISQTLSPWLRKKDFEKNLFCYFSIESPFLLRIHKKLLLVLINETIQPAQSAKFFAKLYASILWGEKAWPFQSNQDLCFTNIKTIPLTDHKSKISDTQIKDKRFAAGFILILKVEFKYPICIPYIRYFILKMGLYF